MEIIVGDYVNEKVNGNGPPNRLTVNTTLVKQVEQFGGSAGLGGVDHYMCRSIKTIVSRYVARLKRDADYGYTGAAYNIVIELHRGYTGLVEETVIIPIRCV